MEIAKKGMRVCVRCSGWLPASGKTFEKSAEHEITLGLLHMGFSGFDKAVIGMLKGEVRKVYIPAALGYRNAPPAGSGIPKNADLCFEFELLKCNLPPPTVGHANIDTASSSDGGAKTDDAVAAAALLLKEKAKADETSCIKAQKRSALEPEAGPASKKAKLDQEQQQVATKRKVEEAKKAADAEAKKKSDMEAKKKVEETRKAKEMPKKDIKEKKQFSNGLVYESILSVKAQQNQRQTRPGNKIKVQYEGSLAKNGKRFDKGVIDFDVRLFSTSSINT